MRRWAIILLAIPAAACVSVRPLAAPSDYISKESPELVWAHHQSGEVVPVYKPAVRGDTLVGTLLGTAERVHTPLPSLRVVEAKQKDSKRTAFLVAGVGIAAGFVIWRATESGGHSSNCVFDAGNNRWNCP